MTDKDLLAEQFEEHRSHLRAVAYRMLGSPTEADDAVQDAWLRVSRAETDDVRNLGGWLTTVVARVCLNRLRSRAARREDPLDFHIPDPIVTFDDSDDPEHDALLAESVGLALLVVLDTLPPAERLAFVLHDMFAVPFDDIATIIGRSPTAARQLASRARRRVRGVGTPEPNRARQREVVDAFFAAANRGDFQALVSVLDPDVVLRADRGALPGSAVVRGAQEVASRAVMFADPSRVTRAAIVNGAAGVVITEADGHLFSIMGFTVADDMIVAIDALGDPERLDAINIPGNAE
jgi:RNA polymerase sigma-70 factor (ECF subfamily)